MNASLSIAVRLAFFVTGLISVIYGPALGREICHTSTILFSSPVSANSPILPRISSAFSIIFMLSRFFALLY